MRDCVASYACWCARGMASIGTMETETSLGCEKVLTIEVRNTEGRICRARGRMNRLPAEKELNILRRWAAQAGLTLSRHVG